MRARWPMPSVRWLPARPAHALARWRTVLEGIALYQLLPLLVHAALFGGGYATSAEGAARRYV